MRSSIGGESRLNKSLIESSVQLFGMTVVLRRGGGFIRGTNGSPEKLQDLLLYIYTLIISYYFHNSNEYKIIKPYFMVPVLNDPGLGRDLDKSLE